MSSIKRLEWIDIVKGLAIIYMLINYSIIGYTSAIKNRITAINMSLFFFVIGYLKEEINKKYYIYGLGLYLKKQFIALVVSYIVFCLLHVASMFFLSFLCIGLDFRND